MNSKKEVQHVYLVGAKSLGAYGGYETFVYKLTEYHQNKENIKYHVACKANGDGCMDESKFEGVTKINDAANAASLTGKLLQMSNGAVYDENGKARIIHDHKLEACRPEDDRGGAGMNFADQKMVERLRAEFPVGCRI